MQGPEESPIYNDTLSIGTISFSSSSSYEDQKVSKQSIGQLEAVIVHGTGESQDAGNLESHLKYDIDNCVSTDEDDVRSEHIYADEFREAPPMPVSQEQPSNQWEGSNSIEGRIPTGRGGLKILRIGRRIP